MKISQLIYELKVIQALCGDLDVLVKSAEAETYSELKTQQLLLDSAANKMQGTNCIIISD